MADGKMNIEPWIAAEFDYAQRLRVATREERRGLYVEAYETVSKLRWGILDAIDEPELRAAGTTRPLAEAIASHCAPSDRVVEFGCGRGLTAMIVAPRVQRYVATDVSQPSLDETGRLLHQRGISNVEAVQCTAMDLALHFSDGEFTKAISIDVTEHLHPEDAAWHYREAYRILAPGGWYFISTPNVLTGPHDVTRSIYPCSREPLGFHLNEGSHASLESELREAGFSRFFAFSEDGLERFMKKKFVERWYRIARHFPGIAAGARSAIGMVRLIAQR